MSNANLSALSMSELKAIALELNVAPVNDKRSKQSWIEIITLTRELDRLDAADVLSDEEQSEYEGISEALTDILLDPEDTLTPDDEDTWELIENPSHAEQEAIANAVDIAPKKAKSLSALIERELGESALEQTDRSPIETIEPAPSPKKLSRESASGAVLVVAALVCALVLVFRVSFGGVAIALKLGAYIVRSFGKYDPDLDLAYQLTQWQRDRLGLVPVE